MFRSFWQFTIYSILCLSLFSASLVDVISLFGFCLSEMSISLLYSTQHLWLGHQGRQNPTTVISETSALVCCVIRCTNTYTQVHINAYMKRHPSRHMHTLTCYDTHIHVDNHMNSYSRQIKHWFTCMRSVQIKAIPCCRGLVDISV